MDYFLRIATLGLHLIRFVYWTVAEVSDNKVKPKTESSFSSSKLLKRFLSLTVGLVMGAQLLGFSLLPFPYNVQIQIKGFIFVVIGIAVTMLARWTLGSNWSHAAEYQIRKNQSLVTGGIYAYIRHPLYTGMYFAVLGAEIVAGSFLFIPVFILGAIVGYMQAKKEEEILTEKFGKEYKDYMSKTKMFLPFIW